MKLALLAAAWLAGIFLGSRVDAGLLSIALLLLAALPAAILLQLLGRSLWPVLLAVVLLARLLRTEVFQVTEVLLAVQETETVTLRGRIDNDPEATARVVKFVVSVEKIDRAGKISRPDTKALAYASPRPSLISQRDDSYFRHGDTLLLQGELRQPQVYEDFDYPSYLSHQGISGILWVRRTELISQGEGSPPQLGKGGCLTCAGNCPKEFKRRCRSLTRPWIKRCCWGCTDSCLQKLRKTLGGPALPICWPYPGCTSEFCWP